MVDVVDEDDCADVLLILSTRSMQSGSVSGRGSILDGVILSSGSKKDGDGGPRSISSVISM